MPGGSAFDLSYAKYKACVDEYMLKNLPSFERRGQKQLGEAMRYSVASGGKRLRGVLALATYSLFGGDISEALPLAGSIEYIHAYSLIHDDMPCMDDDDFRRGAPSCHKAYGEAIALLAGDALLNLAFEVLLENAAAAAPDRMGGYIKAAAFIAEASGARGMAGGQAIDLAGGISGESGLRGLYRLKTGRLFDAAILAPAIYIGAGGLEYEALQKYAASVGEAFQIKDDLMDVGESGAEPNIAKALGVAGARQRLDGLRAGAEDSLSVFSGRADFLRGAAGFAAERES